jgi:hypothetical protein
LIIRSDNFLRAHRQCIEKCYTSCGIGSRCGVVDILDGLRDGRPKNRGSTSGESKRLSLHQNVQIGSEAQQTVSPELMHPGPEADH